MKQELWKQIKKIYPPSSCNYNIEGAIVFLLFHVCENLFTLSQILFRFHLPYTNSEFLIMLFVTTVLNQ